MQPLEILVDIGGVHHQQIVIGSAVNQQIVHQAAVGIAHGRVLGLPHLERSHIVDGNPLEKGQRARSGQAKLPHVGDIKYPRGAANGSMLIVNPGVLHRHLEAPKAHHLRAQGHVAVI